MATSQYRDLIAILSLLYWCEFGLSSILLVISSIALLMQPRLLFTWFPSLLLTLVAVVALSTLIALNQGIGRRRQQSSLRLFVVARLSVALLAALALTLFVIGFAINRSNRLISIIALTICALHIVFGVYISMKTCIFMRLLSITKSNGNQQMPMNDIVTQSLTNTTNLSIGDAKLNGSMQTIYTMTSDV